MKQQLKSLFQKSGWYVRKSAGLKFGIDLERDLAILGAGCPVRTIFDVGANQGKMAERLLRIFPEAEVYAFEPAAKAFALLSEKARSQPRLHAYHMALGATTGEATLYLNDNEEMCTLRDNQARGAAGETKIKVDTLDRFCHEHADLRGNTLDLLKIDTEGFEIEVLKGAGSLLMERRIRFIYAECSARLSDKEHTSFHELNSHLARLGYNFIALYEQCVWGNSISGYCDALFIAGRGA